MSQDLLINLYKSYYSARKFKRNTVTQIKFEMDFEHHLHTLYDDIVNQEYKPSRSIAFVIKKPVTREIFAADFRDRVVHHLLYAYLNPVFEKKLIYDTYSCRVGKGTLFGIKRVDKMMRSCTNNYKKDAYVLKLDISGYFMNINRAILNTVVDKVIGNDLDNEAEKENILYLLKEVIFHNPIANCLRKGSQKDWDIIPRNKSLFGVKEGCGLPIGNLTSQMFGNIYLNYFDHYIKSELGIKYYGRYVDDMVIINSKKEFLIDLIPKIRTWLGTNVQLQIHPKKIYLQHSTKGLLFLGQYIKPYRRYVGNRTKGNFYKAIRDINKIVKLGEKITHQFLIEIRSTINSYLGFSVHTSSYSLRKKIIGTLDPTLLTYIYVTNAYKKIGVYKWCKKLN